MGKSVFVAEKWIDVPDHIETMLNDESQDFGDQVQIASALLEMSLKFFAKSDLLDEARVKISGETGDHKQSTMTFDLEHKSSFFPNESSSWIKREDITTSLAPDDEGDDQDEDDDDNENTDCDE